MNFDVYLFFFWFVVIFSEFFELSMYCFVRIARDRSESPRPIRFSARRVGGRDHDFELWGGEPPSPRNRLTRVWSREKRERRERGFNRKLFHGGGSYWVLLDESFGGVEEASCETMVTHVSFTKVHLYWLYEVHLYWSSKELQNTIT